ncbi:MAG TPA: hypothetical protein EYP03_00920 [Aquificae bacterium]|nr:hypothetical protein [Aquificota bacterium]
MIKDKKIIIQVEPQKIILITAIFEYYHEVAYVHSPKEKSNIIELWCSPYFVEDAIEILKEIEKKGISKIKILSAET